MKNTKSPDKMEKLLRMNSNAYFDFPPYARETHSLSIHDGFIRATPHAL